MSRSLKFFLFFFGGKLFNRRRAVCERFHSNESNSVGQTRMENELKKGCRQGRLFNSRFFYFIFLARSSQINSI